MGALAMADPFRAGVLGFHKRGSDFYEFTVRAYLDVHVFTLIHVCPPQHIWIELNIYKKSSYVEIHKCSINARVSSSLCQQGQKI